MPFLIRQLHTNALSCRNPGRGAFLLSHKETEEVLLWKLVCAKEDGPARRYVTHSAALLLTLHYLDTKQRCSG